MPSRINSTTTSPGGLISNGDNDNSLLIQTGDITAITINSAQVVSLTNALPVTSGGTGSSVAATAATNLGLGTGSNVQHASLGIGTAASGTTGEIRATNNVTAFFSSDAKLKENIKDVDNALDKVCAIGSKRFDWTNEYLDAHGGQDEYFLRKSDFGVIAQDVQEVFPLAVRTREDGTLAVDYEKLATLAFGAIKELVKRIEVLEAK
jgi:hypothetical protein